MAISPSWKGPFHPIAGEHQQSSSRFLAHLWECDGDLPVLEGRLHRAAAAGGHTPRGQQHLFRRLLPVIDSPVHHQAGPGLVGGDAHLRTARQAAGWAGRIVLLS